VEKDNNIYSLTVNT